MSSEMDISGNGPSLVPGGDASATDIKTELDRILASPIFSGARRPSEFLRYVVETAMKGDGARIKEYLIGIDVFGRNSQYDPRVDPVVRIEAGRLRAKLSQYYAGPGKDDPIVVELPKGSYVPEFRRRPQIGELHGAPTAGAAAIPSDDATVTAAARRAHKRRVGLLVATAGFLTVVATVSLRYDHLLRKPPLNASDTIVVGDFQLCLS